MPAMPCGIILLTKRLAGTEEQLQLPAREDALIGRIDRRHFYDRADEEWARSQPMVGRIQ